MWNVSLSTARIPPEYTVRDLFLAVAPLPPEVFRSRTVAIYYQVHVCSLDRVFQPEGMMDAPAGLID